MRRLISLFLILFVSGCNLFNKSDQRFLQLEQRMAAVEKTLAGKDTEQNKPFDFPMGDSYYLGKKDAKLSIVVFTNLQCGACARADKALREVMNDAKIKENVNLVLKHFPFLSRSKPAVKAAFAAGEQSSEKFWKMAEKMYANQSSLTDENFSAWAQDLGLDSKKFAFDLTDKDKKYDEMLAKDMELVKTTKINGTPYIFIGGLNYDGDLTAKAIAEFIKDKNLL